MTFSYPRYLRSKRTVDERARHPGVWNTFIQRLQEKKSDRTRHPEPLRILEIGGGVGDLAISVLRALNEQSVDYTLVDIDTENLRAARERLGNAFPNATVSPIHDGSEDALENTLAPQKESKNKIHKNIRLIKKDITNICIGKDNTSERLAHRLLFDAICGQAIMDIVPAQILIDKVGQLLSNNGLMYLPIHFDGRTDIEPTYDATVDQRVSDIYHASMMRHWTDSRGDRYSYNGSRSGRNLVMHAASANLSVVEVGASDWIVLPSNQQEGSANHSRQSLSRQTASDSGIAAEICHYPAEEAYFLECMLHFIEEELDTSDRISPKEASAWIDTRRRQLRDGHLALFVHNLDVLLAKTA